MSAILAYTEDLGFYLIDTHGAPLMTKTWDTEDDAVEWCCDHGVCLLMLADEWED